MAIVEQYKLQGEVLRVEMIRFEDSYILEICKWVKTGNDATDKIVWDLTFRKMVKEMFEINVKRIFVIPS